MPEAEVLKVPETDTLVFSIIEELGRATEKGVEKGIMTAQSRIVNTMGPIYKMWTILESIKSQVESGNNASVDELDVWQLLELTEKSMCCVGQANLALTHHRRVSHLTKITGDVKESRKLLKTNVDKLSQNGTLLFSKTFKQ